MISKAAAIAGGVGLLFVVISSRRERYAPVLPPTSGWVPGSPPPPSPLPPMGPPPPPPNFLPQPRAKPKTVKLQGLHRYEIVADVLPVEGVSNSDFAEKALEFFGLTKPTFSGAKDAQREGWEVTRVTLKANAVSPRTIELDRFYRIAGAGTIWIVSARDLGVF